MHPPAVPGKALLAAVPTGRHGRVDLVAHDRHASHSCCGQGACHACDQASRCVRAAEPGGNLIAVPPTQTSARREGLPMDKELSAHVDGHVGVLEVHRPPHNHFSLDVLTELADTAETLVAEGCRALVLCSEGKNF